MSAAVPVVTIDGPSGSGKGTLAYALSTALGFHLLDSGALYRVTALAARAAGVGLDDVAGLCALASALDVQFQAANGDPPLHVLLAGRNVDRALRTEGAGEDASRVAALAPVRAALLERQRAFRRPPGLVADGRDMGTTVFPDAEVKLYLTASPAARAHRRYKQLIAKGIGVSLDQVMQDVVARDRRDSARSASPMKPAADAVVIDTTGMSSEAVVERAMAVVVSRGLCAARQ